MQLDLGRCHQLPFVALPDVEVRHRQSQNWRLPLTFSNKCSAVAEMRDRLATIDMNLKLGALSLGRGGAGSASNTMLPGPRPTFVPSGISIHLAVWSQ